jgi:hypothetical protein
LPTDKYLNRVNDIRPTDNNTDDNGDIMPYLWNLNENLDWTPRKMAEKSVEVVASKVDANVCIVKPPRDGSLTEKYVLLWAPGKMVRLNGLEANAGIRVLCDRDEIRVGSEPPVFFSAEVLVQDEVFIAADTEMLCPRCERPLEDGAPVVRCPACSLAFHYNRDDKTKDCWEYAPTCTCGQSTEMGTGFKWTPHEVWE